MRYLSTRGGQETGLVDAVMRGLAADGGLFVPDTLPRVDRGSIRGESLAEIASEVLAPFFAGSGLEAELAAICADAFDFPLPLKPLLADGRELSVLELFHGPTAAFKDVGARFLAALMERALERSPDARPLTILVATSGDTGGAVAAAFHRRTGIRVGVLFPKGQVSPRQQHQLTCWGDNIRAFEIDGVFDDCQALVKAAFSDPNLQRRHRLSAANSINIGRLLPQVAYHAAASVWHWRLHGTEAGSIVPSGNLGNGMACVWARAIGMPVRELVLAVNANRTIPDYLTTGQWQPRSSVATLASAMDVGNPSNMERLRNLLPNFATLRTNVEAYPVDDASIRAQIAKDHARYGETWCPHTATAFWVYDHLPQARKAGRAWIVSATAHPAKFESIVEPVIGRSVPVPPALEALLERPTAKTLLRPDLAELASELDSWK
ncbi:MAG TPA: threonine synthase [Gammaproteobacteria bacterium]|nr:threonine synthase [Gammaproteobacteria bacterium]